MPELAIYNGVERKVTRCPSCGERRLDDGDTSDAERWLAIHAQFPSICDRARRIQECEAKVAEWTRELEASRA